MLINIGCCVWHTFESKQNSGQKTCLIHFWICNLIQLGSHGSTDVIISSKWDHNYLAKPVWVRKVQKGTLKPHNSVKALNDLKKRKAKLHKLERPHSS